MRQLQKKAVNVGAEVTLGSRICVKVLPRNHVRNINLRQRSPYPSDGMGGKKRVGVAAWRFLLTQEVSLIFFLLLLHNFEPSHVICCFDTEIIWTKELRLLRKLSNFCKYTLKHMYCTSQGSYYFAEFIFPDFSRQNE